MVDGVANSGASESRLARQAQFVAGDSLGDRYRIVSLLGSGGMGEVYEVDQIALGRHFAAKVLRRDLAADSATVGRFRREVRAMARLRSDHVARIVDIGALDESQPFFVMDLLEGADLRRLLERTGAIPVRRAVRLIIDACWGLRAVHAAGLVHRDIKPANLFVTRQDSGEERCVLLDLGVTKSSNTTQTREGQLVGTLSYMAPEQLDGGTVDTRTDLYTLGTVLYECLAGKPPHHGKTIERVLYSIMNSDPVPLHVLRPEIPRELCDLVSRAIDRQPSKRFSDAATMAQALSPFGEASKADDLCGSGVATIGFDLPAPSRARRRKGTGVRWTTAAILCVGSACLGWMTAPWVRSTQLSATIPDANAAAITVPASAPEGEPKACTTLLASGAERISNSGSASVESLRPNAAAIRRTEKPIRLSPKSTRVAPSKRQPHVTQIDSTNPYDQ